MSGFLEKIHGITQERVRQAIATFPPAALKDSGFYHRTPHEVIPAFQKDDYNIIAEVKFASPSEGEIHAARAPEKIAAGYLEAGATMLSVLTEPQYFKGSLDYLSAIRKAQPDALLLRKDFIIDPYQLLEARAAGADAVLLIVAMTGSPLTADLHDEALALGLTPLVEVHDAAELEQAADFSAKMIGVNNRNLKTLKTELDTSRELAAMKPEGAVFICESGLKTAADLGEMRGLGYDGFLMGTHFMRGENPGAALRRLREDLLCM
ncbi:MAG: indole-3-glycerol-phosphate synthase TrpC [Alphaproteobacteria bacterium]|nr:indole-3-glycerol-phosphate synthase TrpC [Alphaproteobacteria bacterium]